MFDPLDIVTVTTGHILVDVLALNNNPSFRNVQHIVKR